MRIALPVTLLASSVVIAIASCGGGADTASSGTGFGGESAGSGNGGTGDGHGPGPISSSSTGINLGDSGTDGCPTATTCEEQGANCGPIGDGCGGELDCGDTCPDGETCGGAGTPSVCGAPPCTGQTCTDLGFNCGMYGDGCGGQIDCGACSGTDSCGGGGTPGNCGTGMMCMPKTCADLNVDCGLQGDGCGAQIDCGTCSPPSTCGGGGVSSVCGSPPCTPSTCTATNCGPVSDGCGGLNDCGTCDLPTQCGGLSPSNCGVPATCTNLCLQQVTCPAGSATPTTQISGVVYAPNGVDPLPNVLVFVPNAAVQAFTAGVSCDNCASSVTGSPLVSAVTDTHGRFTITNAPVGTNIPIVIQTGRWRRQAVIPNVSACVDNGSLCANPAGPLLTDCLTRLPRKQSEGDIPHMAFATGSVDVLECVIRKIGVDNSEFKNPGGGGRIDIYQGDGQVFIFPNSTYNIGGAKINSSTPPESTLVNSLTTLKTYDMVLFPCKGAQEDEPGVVTGATPGRTAAQLTNMVDYLNAGGRVFATHYSYVWFDKKAPFNGTANWSVNQTPSPVDQTGFLDMTFPKGQALAEWLQFVQLPAVTTLGQIPVNTLKRDLNGVVAPSQEWMRVHTPQVIMHYTFNTPVGAPADQQCGRALFDDFHVENKGFIDCPPGAGCTAAQTNAYNTIFPAECVAGAMTPQEKLLEFMIFDLGSCVTPDQPTCDTKTCGELNIGCGPAGDGCGGLIQCGNCPAGQTCGGGGMPGQCGAPTCNPDTCNAQNIHCGPAGDGCGNLLDCGTCPAGQTCGGGGMPGVCGSGTCNALTCQSQGIMCGPAGDGCGNVLQCGTCPAGETCGGGGMPGICGNNCTPRTCAQQGFDCGQAGDGCGNAINCGTCNVPQTCGGGGQPNVCGGTQPH